MVPIIDSEQTRQLAHHHMVELLNGSDPREAARYAETARVSEEWEWAAQELLAVALIDSGTRTASAADLRRGVDILERAPHADSPMTRYNVANGKLSLWEIASRPTST